MVVFAAVLMWAVTIGMHALDVLTTMKAVRLPGLTEGNPLVRDKNKKFVLWKGLLFKIGIFGPLLVYVTLAGNAWAMFVGALVLNFPTAFLVWNNWRKIR
jgi:hypothetical protein